ncbi:hypothetical protein KDH_72220 [Dictyobacter sp. S3.2.2.5]|uniref:Protein kinase domain-containing protein n=1 Tax=Dictyobacter halimunensis TaxID=3026934 RepID=A0ABQ6G6H1_9CHLR|nr:hypothetical protein KDH_72220 [Dictyobacter sp. S3.2.2.5]
MASVTLQCGSCGAENGVQAAFCQQCGQPLSSTSTTATGGVQTRLLPDDVLLNDRYRIVDRAGTGGFGAVYKAADTRFGDRPVAIKEMGQKGLSAQELAEAIEGFRNEALLLANLNHPHLPRIYDHFSDGGRWYLVMDYIEGVTLEDYLEKAPVDPQTGSRHLSVDETLAIGQQLCTVLDYLHTRRPPIIFRDLKPANVMRVSDGHLYLIDFGIARHFKPGQIKDTIPLGSPGYAAPEQYGKGQTTPRADIYGLGVMLHQCLSGDDPALTPFHLVPLHLTGNPALKRLETLILQMTEMDEQRRPSTAAVVKEELSQIAEQLNSNHRVLPAQKERPRGGIHHVPTDEYEEQTGSGQQMLPPTQRGRPPRRGPSRRTFIIGGLSGLAGLFALVGAETYAGLHRSDHIEPGNLAKPAPGQAPLEPGSASLYVHSGPVYSVAWSPDGRSIVSASGDKTVQIRDASSGKSTVVYKSLGDEFYQALWTPDGKQIISGGSKGVQRWQASNGRHIYTYNSTPAQPGHDMALSPNGIHLAVAKFTDTGKCSVQLWNTGSNTLDKSYDTDYVYSLAWSPDGRHLAIGTATGDIRLWDIETGDTPLILNNARVLHMIRDISWSPDGNRLAVVGTSGKFFGWNIASSGRLEVRDTLSDLTALSDFYALAWSPDGSYLATGHSNGEVCWRQVDSNELLATSKRQHAPITTVAWSPDGKAIASSSEDHTVQIWQPNGPQSQE